MALDSIRRLVAGVALAALAAACSSSEEPGAVDHGSGSPPATNGADAAAPPTTSALCGAGTVAGDYCGNDKIEGGDPSTLYTCARAGDAPIRSTPCAAGCVVAPAGTDDSCKVPSSPNSYRLPWPSGVTMQLTQDCDDACCNDHVGTDAYAWDWANGTGFVVRAARAGTITHMKLSSTTGCGTSTCSTYVNMIVVDHGDGTQAVYMHLKGSSAEPGVTCGAAVTQGQALAIAGTTGHSTGVHLHFQVNGVHAGAPTCECGSDGLGCADTFNPFPNMWVSAQNPTQAITFEEWPTSSQCANRRITMPASQN